MNQSISTQILLSRNQENIPRVDCKCFPKVFPVNSSLVQLTTTQKTKEQNQTQNENQQSYFYCPRCIKGKKGEKLKDQITENFPNLSLSNILSNSWCFYPRKFKFCVPLSKGSYCIHSLSLSLLFLLSLSLSSL